MQDWRDFSSDDLPGVLRTARELIARQGYHGTSIRDIARGAEMSVPGVYHHYASKQVILDELVSRAMAQLLTHVHAADAASNGNAASRFDNVIECMLRFHIERREDAFVASTEMRSMEDSRRRVHVSQRDTLQALIGSIIKQGVSEGVFTCEHVADAARAVSSLCVSVADWYRPSGPLSINELIERYGRFARGIVGGDRSARLRTGR